MRAPDITREMLERLAALGREAASGKLRPEEFVEAAKQIHPSLGKTVLKWAGYSTSAIGFLIWMMSTADMLLNWKERLDNNPALADRLLEGTFGAISSHFQKPQDHPFGDPLQNTGRDNSGNNGSHPTDEEGVVVVVPQTAPDPAPKVPQEN